MSLQDVVRVCWTRWYVVLVGLLLTGALLAMINAHPGVYWARTTVVFHAPTSVANPNSIRTTSASLIQSAGVVSREVTGRTTPLLPVDPSVRLVDQGVRDGYVVFQPNTGGQWAPNFATASVVVDVAAPSAAQVSSRTAELVSRIQRTLLTLQEERGVSKTDFITAGPQVAEPQVQYDDGRPRRAEIVALAIGIFLTAAAAVLVDGLFGAVRRRKVGRVAAKRLLAV